MDDMRTRKCTRFDVLRSGSARLALLLLVLTADATAAHAADVQRWTDRNGRVVFGDHPPVDVQATAVKVRPNVYTAVSVGKLGTIVAPSPEVVLYSAEWCGFCRAAREHFRARGIAFSEYDVESSERGRADYAKLGARGVPVILIGERRMNGFNADAFDEVYRAR